MLIAIFSTVARSQTRTNLVFFSENGERFSIVINGILQNSKPETNIKITDLIQPTYKIKVLFENRDLGEIDKSLMFKQGTETNFCIRKNNKGEYVVRWVSDVPIEQAQLPAANQNVIVYSDNPPQTTTTVSQTQTTTYSDAPQYQENGNVGMNINATMPGVNVSMNVEGPASNMPSTTTNYSTTTTTTTSTNGYSQNSYSENNQNYRNEEHPQYHNESNHHHSNNPLPGYSGSIGCPNPMMPTEFDDVKRSISSKTFEDSKLTIAKQVIGANCLLCSQVKEIMLLFTFEATRLDLAKFAYKYTYDISNYYKLNDAFTFESSIDELNNYINGKQ